jgi:FMN phosphatase YigB (HAD superfamily)
MNTKPRWRLQDPRAWTITNTTVELLEHEILQRAKASERTPAVVFDLDGTLFDVSFRTFAILEDWVRKGPPDDFPEHIFARLASLRMEDIGYSVADSFERMGFDIAAPEIERAHKIVNRAWKRRFFDGETLVLHDKPHPGALAFVRTLHAHGIHIIYLTGRSQHSSATGTRLQLEKAGFPLAHANIILKEDETADDAFFKAMALGNIASRFSVIANFENEYSNLAAMSVVPQNILHVVVDAPHSSREIPDNPISIFRLLNFSRKN